MRRLVALAVGLAVVAAAAPSVAAGPRVERRLMVFSYDGRGPAILLVQGEVEAKGVPGYFATVSASEHDGELDPYFPDVLELGEPSEPPRTYGALGARDLCASPVVSCTRKPGSSSLGFSISYSIGRGDEVSHTRLYLAMEGTRIETSSISRGWRMHSRSGGLARSTAGGTGARAFGASVEAQPEARLPGGRRGSIGIGVPPCDELGLGIVSLTGGRRPVTDTCPAYPLSAAAKGATQWVLSGTAAGLSSSRTRLLVIDL